MQEKMDYKDIKLEEIEEHLKGYEKQFPFITHYQWEENGEKFSSWKIITGTNTIRTGDGGMKMIEEAFKKEAEKYLKKNKICWRKYNSNA